MFSILYRYGTKYMVDIRVDTSLYIQTEISIGKTFNMYLLIIITLIGINFSKSV